MESVDIHEEHRKKMDELMEEAKILTKKSDTKEATTMESENENKKSWLRDNADIIGIGLTVLGVIGFTAICAVADANEKKIARELYEKAIDADLEARKYEADKKCEAETKTTSDIKDIVHDITTIKN